MGMKIGDPQIRQGVWLVVGTLFPFLLVFALPLFGLSEGVTLTAAKVALFGFHVLIMVRHGRASGDIGSKRMEGAAISVQEGGMHYASVLRCGFALGTGTAIAYLACAVAMAVLPRSVAARFLNNLVHGVDLEPMIHWNMSLTDTLLGLVSVFILGWLFAAVVAGLYNLGARLIPPH